MTKKAADEKTPKPNQTIFKQAAFSMFGMHLIVDRSTKLNLNQWKIELLYSLGNADILVIHFSF